MKILIISNHAYPAQLPRAFRTSELSEQLAKMGHEVTLYTVTGKYDYSDYESETGVNVRPINSYLHNQANDGSTKRNLFDRFMTHYFHRWLFWPQCEFHFAVDKIIKDNPNMDLLITVAYPHSIHSGAARAKRKHPDIFPKKWICDCGDPFMLNPFFNFPQYFKKFEDQWCSMCDYITVPTTEAKKGYYEQYRDKIRVIPQGFDFSKTPIDKYVKNDIPTFVFVGAVYEGIRDPRSFMKWLLTFKGPYKFKMLMRTTLDEKFVQESNGQIEYVIGKNRKEVIQICSTADFLINITNPTAVQSPSKLIDYGIAGRPILDVPNDFNDPSAFMAFYKGDYTDQHVIENLDDYRIENVTARFLELAK